MKNVVAMVLWFFSICVSNQSNPPKEWRVHYAYFVVFALHRAADEINVSEMTSKIASNIQRQCFLFQLKLVPDCVVRRGKRILVQLKHEE